MRFHSPAIVNVLEMVGLSFHLLMCVQKMRNRCGRGILTIILREYFTQVFSATFFQINHRWVMQMVTIVRSFYSPLE